MAIVKILSSPEEPVRNTLSVSWTGASGQAVTDNVEVSKLFLRGFSSYSQKNTSLKKRWIWKGLMHLQSYAKLWKTVNAWLQHPAFCISKLWHVYHASHLQLAQGEILVLLLGILVTHADACGIGNLAMGTTLKKKSENLYFTTQQQFGLPSSPNLDLTSSKICTACLHFLRSWRFAPIPDQAEKPSRDTVPVSWANGMLVRPSTLR